MLYSPQIVGVIFQFNENDILIYEKLTTRVCREIIRLAKLMWSLKELMIPF